MSQPSAPLPVLRTLGPGEEPSYPGLRRDGRGVVAGTQGLVAVHGARRLAAFLAALSQVADLSRGVAAEAHEGDMAIVTLTPADAGVLPSQVYDAAQGALAAARLSAACARLYTGDGRVFVPYTDPAAPHGYDVEEDISPESGSAGEREGGRAGAGESGRPGRVLLHEGGGRSVPLPLRGSDPASARVSAGSALPRPLPLLDALLQLPLRPAPQAPPRTLALLTDRRLAALVAGYVQRHGLAYAVRFLSWRRGAVPDEVAPHAGLSAEVALFEIVSAAEERAVPDFICDFLRRLPRTTLLVDALVPADLEHEPARRALVAWAQRTPLYLPHIQDLLPAQSILVLSGAPWGAGLIEAPPPRTAMQQLSAVESAAPARAAMSERPAGQLRLTLALRRDGPAHGPIHGLLLDGPALARLRRMVRHLPAPLFAGARVAIGDGVALVVAADEGGEIEGLPLGLGLTGAEPPALLLPRGMRLLPALPQDLLIPALDLRAETLTVLTPSQRYDVPLAALQPLSSLLALDPAVRSARMEVRPSSLPPLDLSGLDEPDEASAARTQGTAPGAPPRQPPAEPEQRGVLQRLIGQRPAPGQPTASFEQELRRRAADLEQRGEHELAAAFYTYLNDSKRAAACYRRLVERAAD